MLVQDVVAEAFRLRQLWHPSRHRILRVRPEVADSSRVNRLGEKPAEAHWQHFEPTAFLYAYTAFNSLYTYDWQLSMHASGEEAVERGGKEEKRINRFIGFTLEQAEHQTYFLDRLRAIAPSSGRSVVEELDGLKPLPTLGKASHDLRPQVIAITRALYANERRNVREDAKVLFKAVYRTRCNIFHGRKTVLDLADDNPQLVRIGIFRQMIVALIDTFFYKVNKLRGWDTFFEAHLRDTVSEQPGMQ